MSELLLIRRWREGNAFIGVLYWVAPTGIYPECYTCENIEHMIPEGRYKISLYPSPKNKREVPLLDVPGRQYIEIHIANKPEELEGCIAIGKERGTGEVLFSRLAFNEFMPKLELELDKSDVWIEIKGEEKTI